MCQFNKYKPKLNLGQRCGIAATPGAPSVHSAVSVGLNAQMLSKELGRRLSSRLSNVKALTISITTGTHLKPTTIGLAEAVGKQSTPYLSATFLVDSDASEPTAIPVAVLGKGVLCGLTGYVVHYRNSKLYSVKGVFAHLSLRFV